MYVLVVFYDKEKFPEYEELLGELKKIPDTIIVPMLSDFSKKEDIYSIEGFQTVRVDVYEYDEYVISVSQTLGENEEYEGGEDYVIYSNGRVEAFNEEGEIASRDVNNNKQAISTIVEFTRKVLAKISGDKKYEEKKRSEIEYVLHTDLNKIDIIHTCFEPKPYPDRDYEKIIRCKPLKSYYACLFYVYPYMGRYVIMEADCCIDKSTYAPQKCYLFIIDESENGEYKGNKYFVIDKPPKASDDLEFESKMEEEIRKMARDIERVILEYNTRNRS
ncbi:MAG: hypothetical protein JZD40_03540 [Sulfolobus sp.]|nr:hypothetical protein [Sulfolobus sp.]